MRILVLQLARFGDIYQSWPTLRALRRSFPAAEVHLLTRSRFREAADTLPGVHTHALPTQEILGPILHGRDEGEALQVLHGFITSLAELRFERIINLSFSPLSSYLTDALTGPQCEVRGYTRHSDGHFNIADDSSSYFYAQVGIGRHNRYHLTEIFAAVADVELLPEDFSEHDQAAAPRAGVVVHLGASQREKAYAPEQWVEVLRGLVGAVPQITLIGSAAERAMSDAVMAQVPAASAKIRNLVGETDLPALFNIIRSSRLLIGADSAPIHIASLTGTVVLNLSSATVNFWETGPLTAGSRILYSEQLRGLMPATVSAEAVALLLGRDPLGPCVLCDGPLQGYRLHELEFDDFAWKLVQALYTGTPYPPVRPGADQLAFQRLYELAELALQQLGRWNDPQARPTAAHILAEVDSMLQAVGELAGSLQPILQWFETQRLRIPPQSDAETHARTTQVFQDLYWVACVYRKIGDVAETRTRAARLCRECAPELREYNMSKVDARFQELLSLLHELARHSTKVIGQSWTWVLNELDTALVARDYIRLSDFLEWKLAPAFSEASNEAKTLAPDVLS